MWIDMRIKVLKYDCIADIERHVDRILMQETIGNTQWFLKGPTIPVYGQLGVITRYVQTMVLRVRGE